MRQIVIMASAILMTFTSLGIGVSALLGFLSIGQYVEYRGQLDRLEGNDIVLMTPESRAPLDLSFVYDDESEFVINDFGEVKVTGYYLRLFNTLRVEEINEYEQPPGLCQIGS